MEYDLDHLSQNNVFIFKGHYVKEECNLFGFLVLFNGIDFIACYGLGPHGHSHVFALNGLMFLLDFVTWKFTAGMCKI